MDMAHVFGVMAALGLIWTAAFFQLSRINWTILIGVGLILLFVYGFLSPLWFIFFGLIYLFSACFALLNQLRQRYFLKPLLPTFQKKLPSLSSTEREALEAGHTWWEKELFCGRPKWKNLFSMPVPTLTAEEKNFLDNEVETLCQMINDWQIVSEEKDLPVEVWEYIKKNKFLGLVIPKQYGGLGFSALAHSTIVVKIATRSSSAAVDIMVPNSLGPGELLVNYGTNEQKNYYLPRLAVGDEIPCFALTGPDAGSDASGIPDTGIVCRGKFEGEEIIGIRLNWDKRYITLAPIATLLGIAFHLYDPDHLLSDKEDIGISCCLIPANYPGVELGTRHYPLHLAFLNGPTRGKDIFIPFDWIIGGSKMAGQGWKMLVESLSIGRSVSLPALSTAAGKSAYRFTGAYARLRRQFKMPIASFEGVEESLGYIAGYTYMLESTRIMTAHALDQHVRPAIASAIAKYHMTEIARTIVAHAMDVQAGHSIQVGPRNILAYTHFAMPISITVEGANILTRNLIIFGQGAIRCHPYLLKEWQLMSAAEPNIPEIDRVLISHFGYAISNIMRNLAYGLTGGKLICSNVKNRRIRRHHRQLTRMSTALAMLADTSCILLGGNLKRRERISARLGDILSQLYIASAVLKYFYNQGAPSTDVDSVCWCLQESLYKIQIACNELLQNFPNRWIGFLFGWILFPFGTAYRKPKDRLHAKIVEAMTNVGDFRDRLTKYCFTSNKEDEITNRLDTALKQVEAMEPLLKKINKAVSSGDIPERYSFLQRLSEAERTGILSQSDANALRQFEALRQEIIKVNEFNFNLDQVIA